MFLLADCRERLGRPAEAEPLLRELVRLSKEGAGNDSPTYAGNLAGLGKNLLQQQRYPDAETVLRECLAIREAKEPAAWTTYNTKSLLGASLSGQRRYADAEPLLVQGYEEMKARERLVPEPLRVERLAEALERVVRLYEDWDKEEKAAEWRKKRRAPGAE